MSDNTCATCEYSKEWGSQWMVLCKHPESKLLNAKYALTEKRDRHFDTCDHHTPKENDIDARIKYSEQLSDGIPQPTAGHETGCHTLGPWKAEPARPGRECHWTISTVKEYQVQGGTESYALPIAMVSNGWFKYDGNKGKAETAANARLIAKAPTLAAENEKLRTVISEIVEAFGIDKVALRGRISYESYSVIVNILNSALTEGGNDG